MHLRFHLLKRIPCTKCFFLYLHGHHRHPRRKCYHPDQELQHATKFKKTHLTESAEEQTKREKVSNFWYFVFTHSIFHGGTPALHRGQTISKFIILSIFWKLIRFGGAKVYTHLFSAKASNESRNNLGHHNQIQRYQLLRKFDLRDLWICDLNPTKRLESRLEFNTSGI